MTPVEAPELNGHAPADPPPVRFRPGKGGEIPAEWASWMLTEQRADEIRGVKPRKFSDYLQAAAVRFLMDGEPG
jgi:hypothetical protein